MQCDESNNPVKTQNIKKFDFDLDLDFQQILTNPILDIAARFWDEERYKAFRICYRSMRVVDDFIDNRKADAQRITEAEKQQFTTKINDWIDTVKGNVQNGAFQKQLAETRERFQIPLRPWQRFSKSMIYDIKHDGFKTFQDFLKYSEGAAVAPASIFMHLCGVKKEKEQYKKPEFDIIEAARPIALFSYLVHIIRDFQEDQKNNLNYLANNLTEENGLNKLMLKNIAKGGKINPGFRRLMKKYYNQAEHHRQKAREALNKTGACLEPRYQLSLEIIYNLYLQIFERIDITNGRFTTAELCPTPEEVQDRINLTISSFEYPK